MCDQEKCKKIKELLSRPIQLSPEEEERQRQFRKLLEHATRVSAEDLHRILAKLRECTTTWHTFEETFKE